MSARRVRLLFGVLAALPLGCIAAGCDWATEQPEDTTRAVAPAPTIEEPTATGEPELEAEAAILPAFNEEALAARVAGQSRLLGPKSLFEDALGKPVPARNVEEPQGAIEDDILDGLPGSSGIESLENEDEVRANGNALGLYVPLENPKQPALSHFHTALRQLANGEDEDGRVRILLYGASHTQADIYPEYMRTYFQTRFGNGGAGFVPLLKINRWHRPFLFTIESGKRWTVEHAQRRAARKDGLFGLLGASASTTKRREYTKLKPRHLEGEAGHGSLHELFYLAQPGGGKLTLKVDGKKQATINTKATEVSAGYHAFEVAGGKHEIELRHAGGGEVRVFGMTIEREHPGVVVDTLGISGTRAANHLAWDEQVWTDNIQRRNPDLFVLAYGTNEATDEAQAIGVYRRRLIQVLARFRKAVPEASCLLVGPGDFAREVEEGIWATRPRLIEISQVQRDVAWEHGCAFWDGIAFMGGVGSIHTWSTSQPRMASRDHIHLTRRGYVRMAMAITDAIMVEYDNAD